MITHNINTNIHKQSFTNRVKLRKVIRETL